MRSLALGLMLILPGAALAQTDPDAVDRQVQARIETTKQVYGVPDPRLRCRPKPGSDEIVVCRDRGEDQQVERSDPDPDTLEGRRALNGGVPRAPQFDRGSCKGKSGCIQGGWAPPPVYYVDVTKLPEAPPGSDADKIAKGEMDAP
ncbi:MAG: hypothetical protein ACKOPM_06805 [Novosphingobium sp.]